MWSMGFHAMSRIYDPRQTSLRPAKQMVRSCQMTWDISYYQAGKWSWMMGPHNHPNDKAHTGDCHGSHACVVIKDLGRCVECITKQRNTDLLEHTYLSTDLCEKRKIICLAAICFVIVKSCDFFGVGGELGKIRGKDKLPREMECTVDSKSIGKSLQ